MGGEAREAAQEPQFPLRQIYFYLTGGCNLRCRHCWIEPRFQGEHGPFPALDVSLFRSIIDQAKDMGLRGVKLTGGEPLIHPRIDEILDSVRHEELALQVETNGVECTAHLARLIASCEDVSVAVSLDAAEAESHDWLRGVHGAFRSAVRGISALVGSGIRPQIIMSLLNRNKDQMAAVVRLAESLGASSVKFNIVQPIARGERLHRNEEVPSVEEVLRIGRWVERELAPAASIPLFYSHPPAFRPLSGMFGESGDGCSRCRVLNLLGVLSDGSYALCGIGETVPDLVFGRADRDPLGTVWDAHPVLLELRAGLPHRLQGACGRCLMSQLCLGSCIAQNYSLSGHLWGANWFCEEARDLGLFPESRLKGCAGHE